MNQPKFSEVLRAAAAGIRRTVAGRYQQAFTQAQGGGYGAGMGRTYSAGEYEAENASYRALEAQANMLDSMAELYEKYEQSTADRDSDG